MGGRRRLAMRTTAFATGTVVAGAGLLGAAPVQQPSPLHAIPVVQVHDVALASSDLLPDFNPIPLEAAFVQFLLDLEKVTGLGDQTPAEQLNDFGLGSLTPNELLSFTGLGNVTVSQLDQFADLFGLGQNPVSVVLAATGLTDATTLSQAVDNLGIGDQPLSDVENLFGLSATSTLTQTADALGIGDQPVSNLEHLVGLNTDSTLSQTADALGIENTQVDALLGDFGIGSMNINGFLQGLDVTPSQLLDILGIQPGSLGLFDPQTDAFTAGTTVETFADTAGLGHDSVTQLLATNDIGDATLGDATTTIGLNGGAGTVDDALKDLSLDNLSLGGFESGFGLNSDSTLNDLFTNIPGFDNTTIGGLLAADGLSDQSTIDDVLKAVPGLGGTTLSGLVGDLGLGDDTASQLASNLLDGTTVDQYLTNIADALGAG
jgi:hypothetical protein